MIKIENNNLVIDNNFSVDTKIDEGIDLHRIYKNITKTKKNNTAKKYNQINIKDNSNLLREDDENNKTELNDINNDEIIQQKVDNIKRSSLLKRLYKSLQNITSINANNTYTNTCNNLITNNKGNKFTFSNILNNFIQDFKNNYDEEYLNTSKNNIINILNNDFNERFQIYLNYSDKLYDTKSSFDNFYNMADKDHSDLEYQNNKIHEDLILESIFLEYEEYLLDRKPILRQEINEEMERSKQTEFKNNKFVADSKEKFIELLKNIKK